MKVSVLTPSIPERADLLEECVASVAAQLFTDFEHIVEVDVNHAGCSVTMNHCAMRAQGEWLLPLADDDLLVPGALRSLTEAIEEDVDVVYAPPLVTGNEDRWWFYQAPPVIPAVALMRKGLWNTLGGYDTSLRREEDRDLWIRALNAGANFKRIDAPVWIYRQWSGNKSFAVAA